jgi:hypothetical protein
MLSRQEEEQERRETLENDLKVLRERGSTFHQHGLAQADEINQGRFAATGAPRVVGSTPTPASQYPAASAAHQTELPPEQPLGFAIDQMPSDEPSAGLSAVQATGGAAAPSAPPDVEPAPPSSPAERDDG